MAETMTLAELPPDVAEPMLKRILVRLRPPLPPELSWVPDPDQPSDGRPTETTDVEFVSRGKGMVVPPVNSPTATRLASVMLDDPIPSLEMSAPYDLAPDGPTERVNTRDGGEYTLECWFGEEELGQ